MRSLLDYRTQRFTQNGEEDVIARVFEVIGDGSRFCCEFGAWDGIFLSNTRPLVLNGWSALLIEGCPEKFRDLQRTYAANPKAILECAFVDGGANSLANTIQRLGVTHRLDFLSIDIDGLDFNVFSTLDRLPALPRFVVVEVQPEHGPSRTDLLPDKIAQEAIGQPLAAFVNRGKEIGYRLICYLGCNAYFVAEDVGGHADLPTQTAEEAWEVNWRLSTSCLRADDAAYLYRRNNGLAGSLYRFNNPRLSADLLGIPPDRVAQIERKGRKWRLKRRIRNALRFW